MVHCDNVLQVSPLIRLCKFTDEYLAKKLSHEEFDGRDARPNDPRIPLDSYYMKMGSARFGLPLPGIGYDSWRYKHSCFSM